MHHTYAYMHYTIIVYRRCKNIQSGQHLGRSWCTFSANFDAKTNVVGVLWDQTGFYLQLWCGSPIDRLFWSLKLLQPPQRNRDTPGPRHWKLSIHQKTRPSLRPVFLGHSTNGKHHPGPLGPLSAYTLTRLPKCLWRSWELPLTTLKCF